MRKSRGLLPTGTDMRRKVARVIPEKQELLDALHELSTEPFRNLLAEALDAAPSPEALAKMAKDRPSDWATYVKTLANLSGYADKKEVKVGGVLAHIHEMSDAELLDHARRLTAPKIIDGKAELCDNGRK